MNQCTQRQIETYSFLLVFFLLFFWLQQADAFSGKTVFVPALLSLLGGAVLSLIGDWFLECVKRIRFFLNL